ncbi:MAG TPA: hypothetical protein DHU55_05065 [Blastocatellia bacterium]|nr:hypothetical protein [Blastocatellia bacterium]HCX29130.1 hypothetical protein [Blastocatellia bacterium]
MVERKASCEPRRHEPPLPRAKPLPSCSLPSRKTALIFYPEALRVNELLEIVSRMILARDIARVVGKLRMRDVELPLVDDAERR